MYVNTVCTLLNKFIHMVALLSSPLIFILLEAINVLLIYKKYSLGSIWNIVVNLQNQTNEETKTNIIEIISSSWGNWNVKALQISFHGLGSIWNIVVNLQKQTKEETNTNVMEIITSSWGNWKKALQISFHGNQ